MKNVYLLLCLWMTGTACVAEPIHLKRAKQIAAGYTKGEVALRNVGAPHRAESTADEENEYQPLYVFNRGNGEGFVIVSGDDRMPEVLGITDTGDFVESDMPPALLDMLAGYRATVEALQSGGHTSAGAAVRAVEGRTDIAPLIQTHWHQTAPYNNRCPMIVTNGSGRSLTGCTATAASQIVYYWRRDCNDRTQSATPTYSYGDAPVTESVPAGTPLKWDLMQLSYGSSYPAEMGDAVATLMLVTGTTLWQTYGSSTSGELPKLLPVFNGQYGLNATHAYKSGYSTSAWEKLIYDDLAEGHPIEYAGTHPSNGGHAIVLDGYRAADNLFHFNFGWGGQGDGYYTLDDADGVSGFSQYQNMVYKISPKRLNLSGQIVTERLIRNTTNTIRVQLTNNSSLPYSGVYLFCLTGSTKPSGISKATRSNVKTVVPVGQTTTVDFEYNPPSASDYTLYLVDKNNRVLAQRTITPEASVPALTLEAFGVNTNGEFTTETLMENGTDVERTFAVVQYTDAVVSARMQNSAAATYCEPGVRCFLHAYNAGSGQFEQVKSNIQSTTGFEPGAAQTVKFSFTNLDTGKLYKARLSDVITNNIGYTIDCSQVDTVVYFRVAASSLQVVANAGGEMKLEGKWNAAAFRKLSTDASVCRYDLTAVEGVNEQPEAANLNALFYVADDAPVTGNNIIRGGVCDNLLLQPGHDFVPRGDFRARQAVYLHQRSSARWNTLVLPFDCDVPRGVMARRVTRLFLSYIYECDSMNVTLKSGTPYLYMTSAPGHDRFTASDVVVSVNVKSEATDSMRGTFVNRMAESGMYVLPAEGDDQSFAAAAAGSVIPALTAYLDYTRAVTSSSYPYRQKDQQTRLLAQTISEAYEQLTQSGSAAPTDALREFETAIDEAEQVFTDQPEMVDIRTAQRALAEAIDQFRMTGAPVQDGEINLTSLLVNPSFETGNLNGWDAGQGGGNPSASRITSLLANYMSGADGSYVLYAPLSGGASAVVSQTVEGLDNGTYRVVAGVASETGNTVTLFANGSETATVIDDFGPMYLHEAELQDVEVTDGTLTVGVRCQGSWYKADHFRLYRTDVVTGIRETTSAGDDLRVTGGRGCIRMESATMQRVRIYNLSGYLIGECSVSGTKTVGGLPAGVYVVNHRKVAVQ
ncbi:MAG: C10 family peptidase [Clostridium sp.]|nr:C10 family peptidase [Clostridium sp.]